MGSQKVALTGAQETMLATLYGRALDARAADPILGDQLADQIVSRIDDDFARFGMDPKKAMGVAIRVKYIDRLVIEALGALPDATVLHLAAGLDTRAFRLDPDARHEWYDVDLPDVVALRRDLVPERPRSHLIGTSVTADQWMEQVPADRPVVVVAEGLMQYLRREEFVRLLRDVVERFPAGQVVFDSWNSFGARFGKYQRAITSTGATTGGWGIDDPHDLERWVPGLSLVAVQGYMDLPELARAPAATRIAARVMRHVRIFRDLGLMLRYRF
jgi:O-methyltransferase involved in polyketide biosynthesis